MKALMTNTFLQDYAMSDFPQTIKLRGVGKLVREIVLEGDKFQGARYRLTNTSVHPLLLREAMLYRKGTLAIALEHHTLAGGASTRVVFVEGTNAIE